MLAIAGDDFCLAAGDTRQSDGYSIHTRYAPKVFVLCVSKGSELWRRVGLAGRGHMF